MQVVVVGGRALANCLVELFDQAADEVVVINDDLELCEYLSNNYDVSVVSGKGTKLHVLEEAQIEEFDVCVALSDDDSENLAVCQLCQHFFDVKKQVCIVSDSDNVEVFERLGIECAVAGAHLLARAVEKAACGNVASQAFSGRVAAHSRFGSHGKAPAGRVAGLAADRTAGLASGRAADLPAGRTPEAGAGRSN